MSIDRINISNQGIERAQGTQSSESTRNAAKSRQASAGSDSVALSSRASELSRLGNNIEQSRTERFNQIRAELESGTYQVSATDIAAKLIDSNQK